MVQAAAVPFRRRAHSTRALPDLLQELALRNKRFVEAFVLLAAMELDRLDQEDRDRDRAAWDPRRRE